MDRHQMMFLGRHSDDDKPFTQGARSVQTHAVHHPDRLSRSARRRANHVRPMHYWFSSTVWHHHRAPIPFLPDGVPRYRCWLLYIIRRCCETVVIAQHHIVVARSPRAVPSNRLRLATARSWSRARARMVQRDGMETAAGRSQFRRIGALRWVLAPSRSLVTVKPSFRHRYGAF